MQSFAYSGYKELVRQYIDSGINANFVREDNGVTALWIAVQNNRTEVVQVLLTSDADLNICDKISGRSPLYVAAFKGFAEITQILLASGRVAVDFCHEATKTTPLWIATQNGNVTFCCNFPPLFLLILYFLLKGFIDVVKLLRTKGASLEQSMKSYV